MTETEAFLFFYVAFQFIKQEANKNRTIAVVAQKIIVGRASEPELLFHHHHHTLLSSPYGFYLFFSKCKQMDS